MKILILSDLHLEFAPIAIDTQDADVVVLAGDIWTGDKGVRWAMETITVPVIYILGNHEYYKQAYPKLLQKLVAITDGSHVHVLENAHMKIGDVVFWGSTLWTDYQLLGDPVHASRLCRQHMNDHRFIRTSPRFSKITHVDLLGIHRRSVAFLTDNYERSKGSRNVIVTHHAPSMKSVPIRYQDDPVSAAYASNLDHLVEQLAPDIWVHGHMHDSSDYFIGQSRVVCNPRGYSGEPNDTFDPNLVIEI